MAAPQVNFQFHSANAFRTVGGSAFQGALDQALKGGAATQTFFAELAAIPQFLKALHDGRYGLVRDAADQDGDPIKCGTSTLPSGVGVTLVASIKFIEGAGYAFDPATGGRYVAVGTVTLATTAGQQSTSLMLIDANSDSRNDAVLQVLLKSLWSGFRAFVDKMMSSDARSLAGAEALLSDASADAIKAGAIEGEAIADGTFVISVEWMAAATGLVALAALIAIPLILSFIEKK